MAKNASVFYKLPIEVLRGKLATKQDDIRYEGQAAGESILSLGLGKKQAVNFEKYIVLTNRNGKNSFYVKSATSVGNTVGSMYNRVVMVLTATVVDWLYKLYQAGASDLQVLDQSLKDWGEGKTMREYMTSFVNWSIRNRQNTIMYWGPKTPQGIAERVDLCNNPFKSFTTGVVSINGQNFPTTGRQRYLLQQNLRFFSAAMDSTAIGISVQSVVTGTKRNVYLNVQSATTLAELNDTTQARVWGVQGDTSKQTELGTISILDENGMVIMSGKPYKDTAKTQPVLLTDVVYNLSNLYI